MQADAREGLSAATEIEADVLVIGGGPAGAWAAIRAAEAGASVVLADKGWCGASGATAPSGTQIWYVPPDAGKREAAIAERYEMGGRLAERAWSERVLDETFEAVNRLAAWGYPFPVDESGVQQRISVQGPEYMRLMRRRVKAAGVTILDHHPAIELLLDDDGSVAGAAGLRRQAGGDWLVRAGAVVLATGGCAFMSGALGCDALTGDGYLMAAEAGADFSGMEFSSAYAISPAFASVTKTALYRFATFTEADGTPIPGAGSARGRSIIAKALLTRPVFARLDLAEEAFRDTMRRAQPNFFLPFDRRGIDPFTQLFEITLRLEGTVRGTGGIRILDETCATAVPGLFASGDAATRELVCGGFTGGGSHNAAWAISSGSFAGRGAAGHARARSSGRHSAARRAGGIGLRPGRGSGIEPSALRAAVQAEVFPLDRNYFRSGDGLGRSLAHLDALWRAAISADAAAGDQILRTRESTAMLATARWMYRAASERTESRGMHRREDHPGQDSNWTARVRVGGLNDVTTTRETPTNNAFREAAE